MISSDCVNTANLITKGSRFVYDELEEVGGGRFPGEKLELLPDGACPGDDHTSCDLR